jgi:hypothetical protein
VRKLISLVHLLALEKGKIFYTTKVRKLISGDPLKTRVRKLISLVHLLALKKG